MSQVILSRKRAVIHLVSLFLLMTLSCTSTPKKPEQSIQEGAEPVENAVPEKPVSAAQALEDVYTGKADADKALEALEQNGVESADPETRFIYAVLLFRQGRMADARSELESLLGDDPSMAEAWFYLSKIEDAGGNDAARDSALDTAIKANPNMTEALVFRGQLAAARLDWPQAEIDYKRALRQEPEAVESLVGLAWVYGKNDKLREALSLLDQAISLEPTFTYAWVDRARVKASLKEYGSAEDDLTVAITQEPDVLWHYVDRARIRLRYFEDYEGALSDLENVERLDPENFLAMVYLAGLHDAQRRFALAETYYTKVVEMRPDYIWSYMPMGKFAWMRGEYDEAAKWFAKAAAEDPDEYFFQLMTAMSLLRAQRVGESRNEFAELLRRFKPDETTYAVVRFCSERSADFFAVNALGREDDETLRERLWFYLGAIYEFEGNGLGARTVFERISQLHGQMEYDLAWAAVNGMGD